MMNVAYLLLGSAQLAGLFLIVRGFPGAWLQFAALSLFAWSTDFTQVGVIPLVVLLVLVSVAEILILQTGRSELDRKGQQTIGAAGMVGGIVGAVVGLVFPLVGSIAGACVGSMVGAVFGGWRSDSASLTQLFPGIASVGIRTTAGIAIAAFTFVVIAL